MDQQKVIQTNELSKRYTSTSPYALKDLSISINKGEVYGFLGPNGAGKSTAIRTLLHFIQPSSGSAEILGLDIVKDSLKIRRSIGYLSGDFKAYEKMTGKQFLEYMSAIQPLKHKSTVKDLAKTFKATLNKPLRELSKGNRQKIGIIQAFMHEPEVLILDEPTDGLDPLMQEAFYSLVKERQKAGASLFISSHNLSEVKKMCDRVAIIKEGRLVSESTISELATEAAQTFEIVFDNKIKIEELKKISGIKSVVKKNNHYSIHVHGNLSPFLNYLAKQQLKQLATKELNLEDEFLRFYEERVQ